MRTSERHSDLGQINVFYKPKDLDLQPQNSAFLKETLADPVKKTVSEFADHSLTIRWPRNNMKKNI